MTPSYTNVLDVLGSATTAQVDAGMTWYAEAHDFASYLSTTYGLSVSAAAGVIASGSPMTGWGLNKRNAERWISQGFADKYLPPMILKADAIINGADPLDILNSDKVRNFYLCIASEGMHESSVCIDRHAWSVAIGERAEFAASKGRYNAASEAYRDAAALAILTPAQIQAITWVVWRNRFWAEGAFDS